MAKAKTSPKTGGGKRKTTDTSTARVWDMVLKALDNKGGVTFFEEMAEEDPKAFFALVGKALSLQQPAESIHPAPGAHSPRQAMQAIREQFREMAHESETETPEPTETTE